MAYILTKSTSLFQHEYSANFLFTLWKRMRKYGACGTGLTQNVDDLLQSHTARTMLANSEFLLMLNQASTDRIELARLLEYFGQPAFVYFRRRLWTRASQVRQHHRAFRGSFPEKRQAVPADDDENV